MSRRREDHRFLTGAARYVSDLVEDGDLHAHFVRSSVAHGEISAVELDLVPDEAKVFLSSDVGLAPIPGGPAADEGFDRPILASGKVRYVGEPIALVVADSKPVAVDAAETVWVDFEVLPVVNDPQAASDGPPLFDAGNVVRRASSGELAAADHEVSVRIEVENQRLAVAPLEGLAIRAEPQAGGGLLVQCGHQAPHRLRGQLATQLAIPEESVEVLVPDVGGAFGLKGMFFPEYVATCWAALRMERAVVWIESRRESFTSSAHGRGQHHTVTLHGDRTGRISAARIEIIADVGAYPHNGALIPSLSTFVAQGLYDIPRVRVESTTVVTNRAPTGSYRGAGRPEAAYALERAVDAFSYAVDLDPIDVRLANLIEPDQLPFPTATGALYDSGDYPEALAKAIELVDLASWRRLRDERAGRGGNPVGIGVGMFVERAGGALGVGEFGAVEITEDGSVVVRTGSTSAGQGHETVWAELVAAVFDLDPANVVVISGDTREVDHGVGTYASRSAQIGGSALHRSAQVLVDRMKEVAAKHLEASPEDLVVGSGRVHVVGDPDSGLSFGELAREAPLTESEMFVPDNQTFPYGAHVAVVEVVVETGEVRILRYVAVDDCGVVLNPMIVSGQVIGSLAQGFGQAMLEGVVYSESGDPITTSFMDYLIPAAGDTPAFVEGRTVHPAPSNPLGAKGTGEAGCIGAPPAIVNAVLDALVPFGVTHLDMPLRPNRVWEAIHNGRKE